MMQPAMDQKTIKHQEQKGKAIENIYIGNGKPVKGSAQQSKFKAIAPKRITFKMFKDFQE
jgi:hypothetical protein